MDAFLLGMGTGAAVRGVTKYALHVATGGSGYLFAAGAGGISGAILKGTKAYLAERKREFSKEELEKDQGLQSLEQIKEKIARYLELAGEQENLGLSQEKRTLHDELKKELKLKSIRWKNVRNGALTGALVGAFGGFLGAGIVDIGGKVTEHFFGGGHADVTDHVAGVEQEPVAVPDAVQQQIKETYCTEYAKAVSVEAHRLNSEIFTGVVDNGEGITHAGREAIHDYIAEQGQLGQDFMMDREQLIYAEDYLRKTLQDSVVQQGTTIGFTGDQIRGALQKAASLNAEQIDNLREHWTGKISEKTWERMLDYSTDYNPQNNFAEGLLREAQVQAQAAADKSAGDLAQALGEEARETTAPAAAQEYLDQNFWRKVGIGSALLGAFASTVKMIQARREELKKKAAKPDETSKSAEIPSGQEQTTVNPKESINKLLHAQGVRLPEPFQFVYDQITPDSAFQNEIKVYFEKIFGNKKYKKHAEKLKALLARAGDKAGAGIKIIYGPGNNAVRFQFYIDDGTVYNGQDRSNVLRQSGYTFVNFLDDIKNAHKKIILKS